MPLVESNRLPEELDRPEMALLRIVAYATLDVSPRLAMAMLSQGLLSFLPGFLLGLPWVFCWVVAGRLSTGNLMVVLLTPLAFELVFVSMFLFRAWRRWRQLRSSVIVLTDSEMVFYYRGAWRCNDPFATIALSNIEDARVELRRMGCLRVPQLMIDRLDTQHRGSLVFALSASDLEGLTTLVLRERDAARECERKKVVRSLMEQGVDMEEEDLEAAIELCVPYTPTTRSGTIALGDMCSEFSGISVRIPIDMDSDDDILADETAEKPEDGVAEACQSSGEDETVDKSEDGGAEACQSSEEDEYVREV